MNRIGEKADYVRAGLRGPTGRHSCHWPGCTVRVPPRSWGCRPHWYALPIAIRNRIWRSFEPGQEVSKTPSRDYVAAAREAQEWIAVHLAKKEQA
jgi:hypothetical protein